MALELRDGARIYVSGAGSIGLIELALTWLYQNPEKGLVRSSYQINSQHTLRRPPWVTSVQIGKRKSTLQESRVG